MTRASAPIPVHDIGELVGIVGRAHDALQRVAADAIKKLRLLIVGARRAHHPLGIDELGRKIAGFLELEVGRGRILRIDRCLERAVPIGAVFKV